MLTTPDHPDVLGGRERGIVIAADVADLDELQRLTSLATRHESVVAMKVGFSLVIPFGLAKVIRTIVETCSLPVIYDHQKAGSDIPQTADLFARQCRAAGAGAVIVFPSSGPLTFRRYLEAALACGLTAIAGLEMTHQFYLQSDGGWLLNDIADRACDIALELGLRHFVMPGTRTATVRRFASGKLSGKEGVAVLMPGIGGQGGCLPDAFEAARPHRPFAIIGSAIYGAQEPDLAMREFAGQMSVR